MRLFVFFTLTVATCSCDLRDGASSSGGGGASTDVIVQQDSGPAVPDRPCNSNADCEQYNGGACEAHYLCSSVDWGCHAAPMPTKKVKCDDGDKCTTIDLCDGHGTCVGSGALVCDDGNPCTDDACDSAKGCVLSPNTTVCDDGSTCTLGDQCVGGACVGQSSLNCNDGNPCTTDSCDKATGCAHVDNAVLCNDGNECTTGDQCGGGTCAGMTLQCDDGNPCTTDSCDSAKGCVYTVGNEGKKCDDGDPATELDKCISGTCEGLLMYECGTDADCQEQFKANLCVVATCDVTARKCLTSPKQSDDGNACTEDLICNPETGVFAHKVLSGIVCDDGNACTVGDLCNNAGSCAGSAKKCDDGDKCTADSCELATGNCAHLPFEQNPSMCDDGDPYTKNTCNAIIGCGAIPLVDTFPCKVPDSYIGGQINFSCITAAFVFDESTGTVVGGQTYLQKSMVSIASKVLCEQLAAHPGSKLRLNDLLSNDVDNSTEAVGGLYVFVNDMLAAMPFVGTLVDVTFYGSPDTAVKFEDLPSCVAAAKEKKAKNGP